MENALVKISFDNKHIEGYLVFTLDKKSYALTLNQGEALAKLLNKEGANSRLFQLGNDYVKGNQIIKLERVRDIPFSNLSDKTKGYLLNENPDMFPDRFPALDEEITRLQRLTKEVVKVNGEETK